MHLPYLYTISVFFDIGVSLSDPAWAAVAPARYWSQIAVCTLHCESIITRGSCAARAALSRRSEGCTRRRGRIRCTGRSTGRSRRSGHRRNAGACDSSRQEFTSAKFGMMIWTRIGGSCLGLLLRPADENNIEHQRRKISFVKYQ
jgi:hypothetical protein